MSPPIQKGGVFCKSHAEARLHLNFNTHSSDFSNSTLELTVAHHPNLFILLPTRTTPHPLNPKKTAGEGGIMPPSPSLSTLHNSPVCLGLTSLLLQLWSLPKITRTRIHNSKPTCKSSTPPLSVFAPNGRDAIWTCKNFLNFIIKFINALIFLVSRFKCQT